MAKSCGATQPGADRFSYPLSESDAEDFAAHIGIGDEDDVNDSMDGDHDSAMASAGWGTDEDYGHYGPEE